MKHIIASGASFYTPAACVLRIHVYSINATPHTEEEERKNKCSMRIERVK